MAEQNILEIWELLRNETEARNRRLASEYEAAIADLFGTLSGQRESVEAEEVRDLPGGRITSISHLVEGPGRRLFRDPLKAYRKTRPQLRALDALEGHESGLDDLLRRLPQALTVSGADLVTALGPTSGTALRRFFLRRTQRLEIPLRAIVELHFRTESLARATLDGGCCLLLARGALLLMSPWHDLRRIALRRLAGEAADHGDWSRGRSRWLGEMQALKESAGASIPALLRWTGAASDRLAAAILRGRRLDQEQLGALLLRHQWNFEYWSRQQRAVTALLDLEWEFTRMLEELAGRAAEALAAVDQEQIALAGELDSVIAWLRQKQDGEALGGFPPPSAQLVSAEDRIGAWQRAVQLSAGAHLPLQIESVEPKHVLPPRREPWRRLEPHRQMLSAMARLGRPPVLEGFREVEGSHRAIVRVIERAREVVAFSLESAHSEREDAAVVVAEGLANALALLSYQKNSAVDPRASAEAQLVEGIASAFVLAHLSMEQRRLGLLTQLVRQSGSRAAHEAGKAILQKSGVAGRWVRDTLRDAYHWMLLKIGWETAPIAVQQPIESRPYLGDVLSLQLGARDLPTIYQRLFRLAPVEEPRFLVGREAEMSALAHARELWQSGRMVSVVVVGNRGSGKTSLLNCAAAREFAGDALVRSQFSQRITGALPMRAFLREIFGIAEDRDLLEELSAGPRRVVMLEELERTFLRRVNGFDGLHELLSIVSATSRNTLWILCVNQHCFRYLDHVAGIGQYFSHRINAMALPPENLKNAILLRHNLSGLRLQYPATPDSSDTLRRAQRLFGLEPDAEERYFSALYQQSEGIFRSAFELWQHYMERVEGGVLYLKQPAEPNFEPLIAQFNQQDLFSLQAILQHGSLTEQGHAEVFECNPQRSRIQLEKLTSLECLEPDPAGPGLRIRPEAGRLIHTALHRHNLL